MSECKRGIVKPFTAEAKRLGSGEFLEIKRNNVKDRKRLSFTCDIKDMSDDAVIRIGHGFEISCSSWIELTKKQIRAYNFFGWTNPQKIEILPATDLEFEISDFLTVVINKDVAGNGSFVVVTSAAGSKKIDIGSIGGDAGAIFASPINCEIENCKLSWIADGYADPIWIFGDSYLGYTWTGRWPYYLYRDGYNKVLLAGFSGMGTPRGLEDFKVALEKGTPKYAVWCLGMNDGETTEEPNPDWLAATEEFLTICKYKGITPILATIPNTPVVKNEPKNVWVRNSGYRYIDFNRAVGADKDPAWYPGMLSNDNVHPDGKGAMALYAQVLIDFPEIMKR